MTTRRSRLTTCLLAWLLVAPAGVAQEDAASPDADGQDGGNDAAAPATTADAGDDDRRSERRRRVERETAAWVEQILQEKREREARNAER